MKGNRTWSSRGKKFFPLLLLPLLFFKNSRAWSRRTRSSRARSSRLSRRRERRSRVKS